MTSVLSNLSFKLTGILSTSGTSVTVSNDIERDQVISATSASVVLQNSTGTELERMVCTFAAGTMTILYRGLDQSTTITEVPSLKKEWRTGTTGYITMLAPDVLDINDTGAKTLAGEYTFTGNNNFTKFKVYNYATEAARDIGISTPLDGMIVYINDLEDFQYYKNGTWVTGFGGGGGGGGSGTWYKDSTTEGTIIGAIDGVNTTYVLSNTPGAVDSCLVIFNGIVLEREEDYTLVGDTLEFTTAPITGKIVAIYPTVSIGVSAALTRATTDASATNGELYRSTDDSQKLYYKTNGGVSVEMPEGGITKTSSGATDENKIPVLDANGKLDEGFISLGVFGNGSDGDLVVASGTTTLNAGQEYQYNNVCVCTGAILAFTGCGGAIIRTKNNFINNGTIELRGVLSQGASYFDAKTKINYCDCSTGIVTFNAGYGGLGASNYGIAGKGGCGGYAGGNGCGGAAGGFCGTACNGENNLCGGGGGGGGAGTCATSGCPASGNNGGNGGYGGDYCGSGGGQSGGGGGGGYDTGNGGNGGNGGSCYSSGYGHGGNGGNSGANGGCGGNGGTTGIGGDVGKGGDGYINGGNGGVGGACGSGGARGGNGYIGNGGNGGNGSTCAYGGPGGCGRNGGNGGYGPCGRGNGGNALMSTYGLVATVGCCFNNNGGVLCAKGGNGGAGAVCGCGAHGGDIYILYKCNICSGTICNTGGTGTPAGCNGKLYFSKILGDA